MSFKRNLMAGASGAGLVVAGVLFAGSAAFAQSTGSQTVEAVVITAAKSAAADGLGTVVRSTKEQSIITQDYIAREVGSANFAELMNLAPGVTYSTNDPTGLTSGDIHIHGFDGAHLSFTVDGTPLNDTGNYAIFPAEYAVGESIDRIVVNTGQTEIDSPTASSIGGTVNVITKLPTTTPEYATTVTAGSYGYGRLYGEANTGVFGPTDARARLSFNYADSEKFKGPGELKRYGIDGDIYQPLKGSDFIKVAFTYDEERNTFYQSQSLNGLNQFGRNADQTPTWVPPTTTGGTYVYPSNAANPPGGDNNFYPLRINPVNFGDIRGQSKFTLGHGLTLTVDPYVFYTLANGGSGTTLNQNDPRLIGNATTGNPACGGLLAVSLGRDGNCKGGVTVYAPSNTETHRYGVNSSLIYDYDAHNSLQLVYSLDYGRHRQTGPGTFVDQTSGQPLNVFGAKSGYGAPIVGLDGSDYRGRDRFSIAELNQFSLNYVGKFIDERLHVNAGFRDPHFQRQLNQFCYAYNGTSAYCDTINPALVLAAYNADVAAGGLQGSTAKNLTKLLGTAPGATTAYTTFKYGVNGLPNFRFPFKQTYNFEKILPNVGASFDIDNQNQVYVTASKGFSAPKTDNLYTSAPETVKPETTWNYAAGYRFITPRLTANVSVWSTQWANRIVSAVDPNDPTLTIDRNVGSVHLKGIDLEIGWRVTDDLKIYASASNQSSKLLNNLPAFANSGPDAPSTANPTGTVIFEPTKGKELVYTPDQQFSARAEYKYGPLSFGLTGKYVGERYITDVNDAKQKSNTLVDFDATWKLPDGLLGRTSTLQLNVYNILNSRFLVSTPTGSNALPITYANGDVINAGVTANSSGYQIGYPVEAYLALKTRF